MATQALYLKWRPQGFEEVIGQEHITRTLRNALRQGRIRHAYLFSGPRGTGKTTNARLLAKAVNCTHPDPDKRPCNECHHCQMMNTGRFMDLIEIDAASHTSVDDVRDLREKIAFAPSEGKYKVYIIDEVHRFSGAAFDALLKTLEEPPDHAIFVLATTEIDKVPATIKSRCLLFEFRRVSLRKVVERLQMICDDEQISIDEAALELIARQGTGSVRDSISLLDQVVADPDQHISLELAQRMLGVMGSESVIGLTDALAQQNVALGLDILNEAIDLGADPRQFGQQMVEHLRNVMLVQVSGVEVVEASDTMRAVLQEQAGALSRAAVLKAIRAFNAAVADLRGGWQPQLPLELAVVESLQAAPEMMEAPPTPAPRPAASANNAERPRPAAPAVEAPIEKAVPSPSPAPGGSTGVISITDVRQQWGQLIKITKHKRSSLPAMLGWCDPYEVQGTVLVLHLRNAMLQPKLEHRQNMEPLLESLLAVYGHPMTVRIETVAGGQNAVSTRSDDDLVDFGIKELGAQVKDLHEKE